MSILSDKVYLLEQKQRLKEREQEQRKKEIEEIQKKKDLQAEKKQYEKDLFLACKFELKRRFEEDFRLQGLNAKFQFYNINTRNTIIKSIARKNIEYDYLETNYNKFLKEIIQKYELHKQYQDNQEEILAQEYAERMLPIWEAEQKKLQKKEETKHTTFAILKMITIFIKYTFIICFGFIFLILKLVSNLAHRE